MSVLSQLKQNREELFAIAKNRGAYNLRVFGSVSREEEAAESDIDFLVSIKMLSFVTETVLNRPFKSRR